MSKCSSKENITKSMELDFFFRFTRSSFTHLTSTTQPSLLHVSSHPFHSPHFYIRLNHRRQREKNRVVKLLFFSSFSSSFPDDCSHRIKSLLAGKPRVFPQLLCSPLSFTPSPITLPLRTHIYSHIKR